MVGPSDWLFSGHQLSNIRLDLDVDTEASSDAASGVSTDAPTEQAGICSGLQHLKPMRTTLKTTE